MNYALKQMEMDTSCLKQLDFRCINTAWTRLHRCWQCGFVLEASSLSFKPRSQNSKGGHPKRWGRFGRIRKSWGNRNERLPRLEWHPRLHSHHSLKPKGLALRQMKRWISRTLQRCLGPTTRQHMQPPMVHQMPLTLSNQNQNLMHLVVHQKQAWPAVPAAVMQNLKCLRARKLHLTRECAQHSLWRLLRKQSSNLGWLKRSKRYPMWFAIERSACSRPLQANPKAKSFAMPTLALWIQECRLPASSLVAGIVWSRFRKEALGSHLRTRWQSSTHGCMKLVLGRGVV